MTTRTPPRRRPDGNQAEIIAELRKVGASVVDTSAVGIPGFPDLVAGFRGQTFLLEVKNPATRYGRKGLNANQKAALSVWNGAAPIVVRDGDEALRAIGAVV